MLFFIMPINICCNQNHFLDESFTAKTKDLPNIGFGGFNPIKPTGRSNCMQAHANSIYKICYLEIISFLTSIEPSLAITCTK